MWTGTGRLRRDRSAGGRLQRREDGPGLPREGAGRNHQGSRRRHCDRRQQRSSAPSEPSASSTPDGIAGVATDYGAELRVRQDLPEQSFSRFHSATNSSRTSV